MAAADSELVASLSFRHEAVGGKVVMPDRDSIATITKLLREGPARGLVLLIHGYNNSEQDAEDAYAGFFTMQKSINELKEHRRLADNRVFVEVYWPGDADWGLLSFAFYMGSIDHAEKSAQFLANVLATLANDVAPLDIDIIGHSMGCRLAAELLGKLAHGVKVRVERIALMAAAVPTFMLEQGGALRQPYDTQLSVIPGRVKSLYSLSDGVLAIAFPVGQTLAPGPNGFLPTALGHEQWVSSSVPGNLEQCEIVNAGHSDYWGWKEKTRNVARKANEELRGFLGFNHARDRAVEEREVVEAAGTASRSTLSDRVTVEYVSAIA